MILSIKHKNYWDCIVVLQEFKNLLDYTFQMCHFMVQNIDPEWILSKHTKKWGHRHTQNSLATGQEFSWFSMICENAVHKNVVLTRHRYISSIRAVTQFCADTEILGLRTPALIVTHREENVLLVLVDGPGVGDGICVLDHRHRLSWKHRNI